MTNPFKQQKNKNIKTLSSVVFVLIISVIGYTILFQGQAAVPTAPAVYLLPETSTLAPNTTFTVTVRESSGTTPVNYLTAAFSYPTNLVDFVSIDDAASSGSKFNAQISSSTTNGVVSLSRYINPPNSAPITPATGDQFVATITFKTKAVNGSGSFAFTNATELMGDAGVNLITSLSRTQGSSLTVDVTSPTATLTGITNNQQVASSSTLPVTINATDNTGVTGFDVLVDGALKQSVTASTFPYTYQWNTTGLPLGNHTFQVRAKDAYGNTGLSPTITVVIADKTAPTVSLAAPTTPVKGTVTLNATASDTGGTNVAKVEFYVGSTLIATDTSSPYQATWVSTDGRFPDGDYSLTAKAYDGASPANVSTSNIVNIKVENADKTAPTTPTNFKSSSVGLNSVNLTWSASIDYVGVTGYRVIRNGTALPITTSLSLNDTGLSPSTTYNYTIVALDAAGNQSAAASLSATTLSLKVGDFNADNVVNMQDLGLLLTNWKTSNQKYDINKDGIVSGSDLAILLGVYGK